MSNGPLIGSDWPNGRLIGSDWVRVRVRAKIPVLESCKLPSNRDSPFFLWCAIGVLHTLKPSVIGGT